MSQDNREYQLEDMAEEIPNIERSSAKLWMLTINENCEEWKERLEEYANYHLDQKLKYMCYCQEIAPSTGHVHLHVLLRYNSQIRFNALQREFPNIHIDRCRGTLEQVFKYVTKDGNFKEFGEKPKSRKECAKVLWDNVFEKIDKGKDFNSILRDEPGLAYHVNKFATLKRYLRDFMANRFNGDLESKNLWISGPAGTYKSTSVEAMAEKYGLHIVDKDPRSQWMEGSDVLDQNAVVLIDDMQPEDFKTNLGLLKRLCDRRVQTALPVKGGHVKMDGGCRVVVTSNYSIREMLMKDEVHSSNEAGAIFRRFTEINIMTAAEYCKKKDVFDQVDDWFRQYPFRDETIEWFDQFLVENWDHQLLYDIMGATKTGDKDEVLEIYFNDYPEQIRDPAFANIEQLPVQFEVDEDEPDEETEYNDSIVDE